MYDKKIIIPGLFVFVVLVTFPIWYGLSTTAGPLPNPEKPTNAKQCVEPTEFMRSSHMVLLNDWRDNIVRSGGTRKGTTAEVSIRVPTMLRL